MKKYSFLPLAIIIFLGLSAICFAQTSKTITLKNGSVLKGKVLELTDGIYTIESPDLGLVKIPESNILSILSSNASSNQYLQSNRSNNQQKAQIKSQVNQVQTSILTDPELMMDIQNLIKDEEIQSMLSDPQLLDDVLTYDPERMQQNENVQGLMQNEKMQQLMEKIIQKMPAQE